jgi:hypothetical protein
MSSALRKGRNFMGLKLNVQPMKSIPQLWKEYGPELSKSYDIMAYQNAKMQDRIVKSIKNVSKGANKSVDMEGDDSENIYAISSTNPNEIEIHMKILIKYLQKPREFEIPLLYFNDFHYVTKYINFSPVSGRVAKTSKNSLKYCEAEGKFLVFMISEVKMLPMDVESYVSRDTGKLAFLDFGEVHLVTTEERRKDFIKEYIKAADMTPDVIHCINKELHLM